MAAFAVIAGCMSMLTVPVTLYVSFLIVMIVSTVFFALEIPDNAQWVQYECVANSTYTAMRKEVTLLYPPEGTCQECNNDPVCSNILENIDRYNVTNVRCCNGYYCCARSRTTCAASVRDQLRIVHIATVPGEFVRVLYNGTVIDVDREQLPNIPIHDPFNCWINKNSQREPVLLSPRLGTFTIAFIVIASIFGIITTGIIALLCCCGTFLLIIGVSILKYRK